MQGQDDGETIMPVESFLEDRDGEKPLGVYALYDTKHNIQYVSFSRNVVLSVRVSDRTANGLILGSVQDRRMRHGDRHHDKLEIALPQTRA